MKEIGSITATNNDRFKAEMLRDLKNHSINEKIDNNEV
jgi:hypothetical protein